MTARKDFSEIKAFGKNMLAYKDYIGQVEFDSEAGIFHGEIINTRDVITFQGECVTDLRQAFIDSIEDYLEFCAARGEKPEKPYSGSFVVRLSPELHQKAVLVAKSKKISLNKFVSESLEKVLT